MTFCSPYFFRTAYDFGKRFVIHIIICFLVIGAAESVHHIPGLEILNAFGTDHLLQQLLLLASGMAVYAGVTWLSCRRACEWFQKVDM